MKSPPALASLVSGLILIGQAALVSTQTDAYQTKWCDSTPADGTEFDAVVGQETCVPLCVDVYIPPSPSPPPPPSPPSPSPPPPPSPPPRAEKRRLLQDSPYLLDIRATDISESYPDPTAIPFTYPHDEVNYPVSASLTGAASASGPLTRPYCFTPTVQEECSYTVCFEGFEAADQFTRTEVRCYRINVYNEVLQFDTCGQSGDAELSTKINSQDGLTMSAWVYPSCAAPAGNQTVMYFGSDRDFPADKSHDEGNQVRNAIKWNGDAEGRGSFFYYDCEIGEVMSEKQYDCDVWHYVAVTVAPDNQGYLYVDGVKSSHELPRARDLLTHSAVSFNTPSRPDDGMDRTNEGTFFIGHYPGECFKGYVDEVKVYNYALEPEQVFDDMLVKDLDMAAVPLLKGYYTMSGARVPATIVGTPSTAYKAIPPTMPCVLGMEHSVGPTAGDCSTEVYGWNFADGVMPQCSFGGVPTAATYVSETTIVCDTPVHFSPSFVTVLAANNAISYGSPAGAAKTTTHLFLESSLYLVGGAGSTSGASVDSVCEDFVQDSKAVTVGTWACPKCGPDPMPNMPDTPLPCSTATC